MRALVIGHDHIGEPGHLGAALAAAGWALSTLTVVPAERFARPDVTVAFPDLAGVDLVLTLGAPWPRRDITSWTGTEIAFLAGAHRRGVPVLGVCGGAQFLAEGPDGTVEAFRVGSSIGVQFHPEMSAGLLERWLALTPVAEPEATRLRAEAMCHEAGAASRAARLLRGLGVVD